MLQFLDFNELETKKLSAAIRRAGDNLLWLVTHLKLVICEEGKDMLYIQLKNPKPDPLSGITTQLRLLLQENNLPVRRLEEILNNSPELLEYHTDKLQEPSHFVQSPIFVQMYNQNVTTEDVSPFPSSSEEDN